MSSKGMKEELGDVLTRKLACMRPITLTSSTVTKVMSVQIVTGRAKGHQYRRLSPVSVV